MFKIGNILTEPSDTFNYPSELNVIYDLSEPNNLPTMIIGYYNAKKFPNFNILNSEIGENLYWTFKRTEKRDNFEIDIDNFISSNYKKLIQDIEYVNLDPIQESKEFLRDSISKIYNNSNAVVYIHNNDMIYIYSNKTIYGIDLKLMKYLRFNTEKLISKLKKRYKVIIKYNNLNLDKKYTPFLVSL